MSAITEFALTRDLGQPCVLQHSLTNDLTASCHCSPGKHPGDGFIRFGKLNSGAFLWAKVSDKDEDENAILDVKVGNTFSCLLVADDPLGSCRW